MPLKKMIAIAQNNGWLDSNPFYGYKLTYKQKERSYLTTEELNLIMNADLSTCSKTKQKCRDLFIFSCFTGISRGDLYNLTQSNIKTHKDGTTWLSYTRQKTGTLCNLPLLEIPLRIIKKYEKSTGKGSLFSMPCFVTCNEHIKYIVKYCGINKPVTCHLARHSWATLAKRKGVALQVISESMGHNNENTTRIYLSSLEKSVIDDVNATLLLGI